MSVVRRTKRPKKATKRLDMTAMREALRDDRVWCGLGLVVQGDQASGGLHFEIEEDDVLVEVELVPNEERITARLGAPAGGSGIGVWAVPSVGTEVVVLIPTGDIAFMPCIVATLSSGDLPDGVAENVTVIANGQVLIHDGNGGTDQLVTKTAYAAHVHPTGVGPSSTPDNGPASTSYTQVLKAK